jgi:hypothetical protein
MTNPHNVDICVTCVSEKPPQLPLREELPSMGIEVVYNARGLGAKASKQEQRRKLKQYQQEKLNKHRSLFSRLGGQQQREDEEDKLREEELRIPHALSYTSYQKRLVESRSSGKDGMKKMEPKDTSGRFDESSYETDSTEESSNRENKVDRYTPKGQETMPKKSRGGGTTKPPITNLEIPSQSPEELALKAAFDVFSGAAPAEERTTTQPESREALSTHSINGSSSNLESRQQSHSSGPTTISSHSKNEEPNNMFLEASDSIRRFMGLSAEQEDPESVDLVEDSDETPSIETLEEMAAAYLSSNPVRSQNEGKSPSNEGRDSSLSGDSTVQSKSVRVSRINQNNNLSEFYDLTAISEEEKHKIQYKGSPEDDDTTFNYSNDLSTLSSKNDAPPPETSFAVYPTSATQGRLPGLSLPLPEEDDGYGNIVLDLSDVREEDDGYGNIVLDMSDVREEDDGYGHIVLDLSDVREEDGPGSPLVYSHEARASPQRRRDPMEDSKRFVDFAGRVDHKLSQLRNSRGNSLFDDMSSMDHSNLKRFTFDSSRPSDLEDEDVHQHPRTSYSGDSEINESEHRASLSSRRNFFLPTASPSPRALDSLPDEAPLSPSLKTSMSKESEIRSKLSVSFSQDVESRYYENQDQGLYGLVDEFEHGDLIAQNDSDFDVNVDQKFDSFLSRTRKEESQKPSKPESRKSQEARLRNALTDDGPMPDNVAEIMKLNPRFAREKLPGTDTYPLHAACSLEFPHRFGDKKACLVSDLVNDIRERKELILAFLQSDAACCTYLDSDNDLPVHIICRQLMEWEAKWYQKVYEKAREDGPEHNSRGAGITTLYQTMSQIVDILLKPLAADEELCQQPGGSGYMLPLHIAAIFTVSYDTLKAIIEKYPAAASQKCNLEDIRTFIPNFSIPLELHSRLSTDFPKWEIEANHSEPESEIQWTQSTLDRSYGTKGGMRRSDLMFAFYPDVSPYRHETQRILRLESRIKSEVQAVETDDNGELSLAARLVWEWMCTYEGENGDDNYADSVRRVVQTISAKAVRLLAATPNQFGRPIIDSARSECTDAIQERLDEIANTMIPVPIDMLSTGFASRQRSFVLRKWEETTASQFCLHGRGFVGVLCRTLFNIAEVGFPSNFVLLPYKLVRDSEGRLGLESAEAASTAMKFADCLLQLTDPTKILHFLEKKSIRFQGVSLGIEASPDWDKVEAKTKQQVSKLLSLYASGQGYLYLLDEYTGVPVVPEKEALYPLVISDAMNTVRRILPLMMSGMILMRGEKALSVIANVLLNENIKTVQGHWINAAKDLIGYLYSPQTDWTPSFLNDLRPLRSKLVEFVEFGATEDSPSIPPEGLASEWVVELSLVKMIVEMHDSEHTLCGLRPRRAGQQVLWTQEAAFLDPNSKKHLFQMDFKQLEELKAQSDELDEETLLKKRHAMDPSEDGNKSDSSSSTASSSSADGYELLFRELSFPILNENQYIQEETSSQQSKDLFIPEPPMIVRRKPRYASAGEPISLLNFDDDEMDLDDVLQLRILMDEQEAKLDFLRDKVEDLQVAEEDLLEGEEQLGEMLDKINGQKDILMLGSSNKGLSSARKLLLRICELEDRINLREVEVGQLSNDITCFELNAANQRNGIYFDDL